MNTRWKIRRGEIDLSRPVIMAILNVTPDSFSDGGKYMSLDAALARAEQVVSEGADIIDIGGESTKPGNGYISESEELSRVIPVVKAIRSRFEIPLSVDTRRASVARQALESGADIINDISAFEDDSLMARLVRDTGAGCVLMHKRGVPKSMQDAPQYDDVTLDVTAYLASRISAAERAGIEKSAIVADPGFGFGKTTEHNLALLASLDKLSVLDLPILVGLSRKSFIGALCGRKNPLDRIAGTIGATLAAIRRGAKVIRTHDVEQTRDAVSMFV